MEKEHAIEAVSENAYAYNTLSDELREDRDVVLATVRKDGYILIFMDPQFKEDKEVVLAALTNFGYAIHYTEDLKGDKDVVTAAIMHDGYNLNSASEELQRDPELITLAMNRGYMPTEEQEEILEREQSSKALHKVDAELAPFRQFERGIRANLKERYRGEEKRPRTVGMLNNQGRDISEKLMHEIRSYVATRMNRGKYPKKGGTRKRTKRR
jgi:hypothetical protein